MFGAETHDSPLVGRRLGEFVVREALSSGGFGTVFRAEQPALGREAVIKVMHTRLRASESLIARFLREAKLASRLDHPYAAHIYAFGAEPDGVLWIAMELVRGTPLDKLLEAQGPIPLERFVPLLERLCQVVQTAHDQGIVHRDIKPGNVMVLARAGQLLPKLLDLGIAKLDADDDVAALERVPRASSPPLAESGDDAFAETVTPQPTEPGTSSGRLTEEGAIMGSPLYMAPEQWTDAAAVDARTDIYALGVLSFEALTGRPPFTGLNRYAIAMAHAQTAAPPLGDKFPAELDGVLRKALAKRTRDRYASALELSSAFRAASGIAEETATLPRLPDELRISALARAPQPLAQAIATFEAARNAHQARDAIWQVAHVAVRLIGVAALSAHAHIGSGSKTSETSASEALRALRRRALPDPDWLALARGLAAPFRKLRDVYPIPELVDFFASAADPLAELVARYDAAEAGASDAEVREQLGVLVPLVERVLRSLDFFGDYRLVVTTDEEAEVWMGVRRSEPTRLALRGPALPAGQPALVAADGVPVVSLYPFVQRRRPAEGVAEQLFFFEGKGRRGARLVALPASFEVDDEALWEVLGGMVREDAEHERAASVEEHCPFPGLAAFTADDAARFFGREQETDAFINRLRAQPLLAVVGPSGAGKSSFIQAGVVPNLPADWQVVTLRPGAAPLVSLAARLATIGLPPERVRSELAEHPGGLGTMLRTHVSRGVLVIVVDQLEELFTQCEDAGERDRFVEALVRAARSAEDPVRIVFTLRDDFLIQAEVLPALRTRLAPALHLLTTPGRDELLRILSEPLRQVGYELDDPALAGEMVDALAGTRSALALLSFTASKLWELRDRRFRQISRKAYASLGGVGGALAQHAEAALAAMLPEEQRLVREVFRHAVTAEGTRAVLSRAELDQILGGGVYAAAVIEKLVAARLLVIGENADSGEQVEVTHEALIDAWPRLVGWRREDAEGARLRDQLRAAARHWEERGRASGLLWRGDALAEYRLWRGRYPGKLTDLENAFGAASVADALSSGRRRRVTLAIAFAVLTAGIIALVFLNRSANEQRALAQENAVQAKRAADELRRDRREQAEEQGRSALVGLHDAPLALRYLKQAADLGANGSSHDLLVAFASRVPASKLYERVLPNASNRAAFSPDGTRVAAACDDGSAHVWDVRSGRELLVVHQARAIQRVELTSDGALLTSSLDGSVALWDATSGAHRRSFRAGDNGDNVLCARMSPDARFVVTATEHDAAALWDASTGRAIKTLSVAGPGGDFAVGTPCAFSADSARVAVGDVRGVTRVWSTADGALLATATGHTDRIHRVEFSPDGRLLVTASNDGTAGVWDAATGKRLHELRHRDRVFAATFSPDGKRIATASNDHLAIVWDVATGDKQLSLAGHDSGVNKVLFRSDGAQLATVGDDGTMYLWDAATGRRESTMQGHDASIDDVEYDRSGTRLVTTGDDSRVILWSAAPQQPAVSLVGHTTTVLSVDFSPDGRLVASADIAGTIRIWDRASGASIRTLTGPPKILDARFSPDGTLLASDGADGKVRVWDVASGALVQTIESGGGLIRKIAWRPDGTGLAAAGADAVRVYDRSGATTLVLHHEPRAMGVAFAPSGDRLVTVGSGGDAWLWDLRDPHAPVGTWRAAFELQRVTYPQTGKQVLGSSPNSSIAIVWSDDATPAAGRELRGHRGNIMDAAWSPDGEFVLTGSIDASARLWDPHTGRQLAEFGFELEQVWSVAYSSDGRFVATGTNNGSVTIWELPVIARR